MIAPAGLPMLLPAPYGVQSGHRVVYLPANLGTHNVHAPDPHWIYNPKGDNVGIDARYEGPLNDRLASVPPPREE